MIRGCLTLPFRLATLALLVVLAYLAWENRVALRRWIHRATADPVIRPEDPSSVLDRQQRAQARLDSLRTRRADSVVLPAGEVDALMADQVDDHTGGLVDSVRFELGDGELGVRGVVDGSRLPRGALGPLADWLAGREPVESRGVLTLRRVGAAEWRITQVRIRGVPLPRALWARLLGLLLPGQEGTIDIALPAWVTGLRVAPSGLVLYGRMER